MDASSPRPQGPAGCAPRLGSLPAVAFAQPRVRRPRGRRDSQPGHRSLQPVDTRLSRPPGGVLADPGAEPRGHVRALLTEDTLWVSSPPYFLPSLLAWHLLQTSACPRARLQGSLSSWGRGWPAPAAPRSVLKCALCRVGVTWPCKRVWRDLFPKSPDASHFLVVI